MRLQKQDLWMTSWMGGALAEQTNTESLRRVLDVGCGTGGWLLETANTYPHISLLIGVDTNNRLLQFARKQAETRQVNERVEFHVMDALRMLEFPNDYFDLVNVRVAVSYLRTWDWPKFLQECRRVTRPGGVIRISEAPLGITYIKGTALTPQTINTSSSVAHTRLVDLLREALYQAGHLPASDGDSLVRELPNILGRYGLQNVQAKIYSQVCRAGTEEWQLCYADARLTFRLIVPFLQKWLRVPDDYWETYEQMLSEMQQPDFETTSAIHTIWGNTPANY